VSTQERMAFAYKQLTTTLQNITAASANEATSTTNIIS
jgi:hypothetical protein